MGLFEIACGMVGDTHTDIVPGTRYFFFLRAQALVARECTLIVRRGGGGRGLAMSFVTELQLSRGLYTSVTYKYYNCLGV